ncbi:hypothetical protein KBD33_01175 [Candidatus Gracilibacteria bacterium]|nr:hypothetical protein [Candidatus Gracilibacteria bacterium]
MSTSFYIPTITELKSYYKYVSDHINQTMLVEDLLKKGALSYDDIQGSYDSEKDEYIDIYQWLVFPRFCRYNYDKLVEAHNPILDSENETWVGITSYGSHYDLYVYPQLINIIFNTNISYEDMQKISS